jgi:sugar (pentulose or hexulose) kinase
MSAAGQPEILAIGFSGQMHGPVLLDKAQKPLGNAIIWADQRGASVLSEIEERVERRILATVCGTAPAAGFLISTLFWLQRFDRQRFDQLHTILLPKDYLRFRLCGDLATDPSDAAATGLFDVANLVWSDPVIEKLQMPIAIFPKIRDSVELAGKLAAQAGEALGLRSGIPVAMGSADQPAQAVGNGLFEPGRGSIVDGGIYLGQCWRPVWHCVGCARLSTERPSLTPRWIGRQKESSRVAKAYFFSHIWSANVLPLWIRRRGEALSD